jgi:alkanesulfonate monooxygenase SsuD/methylene tetrahydromethanopterin reductase-like flavin-dependent oxidoreductase (luciferase family)
MALIRRGIHFGSYGRVDDGPAVFDRLAQAAQAAESAGFDAISVPDHVHQNQIAGGPAAPMFEAYTVLGALAMETESAWLLALVSPVTLRSPGLLAKEVTTLDVLSRGRGLLGVGAGWDVDEHAAYGIPFPPIGERFDRLEDTLKICRALFTEQQATVSGTYHQVREAWNSPRPVAGAIRMLVAGAASAALSISWPDTGMPATCSPISLPCGTSLTCWSGIASESAGTLRKSPRLCSPSIPATWRGSGRTREPSRPRGPTA